MNATADPGPVPAAVPQLYVEDLFVWLEGTCAPLVLKGEEIDPTVIGFLFLQLWQNYPLGFAVKRRSMPKHPGFVFPSWEEAREHVRGCDGKPRVLRAATAGRDGTAFCIHPCHVIQRKLREKVLGAAGTVAPPR